MSWMQEAVREWAWNIGADYPDDEWLLSNMDSWERNPHYRGKPGCHPECVSYEDDELSVDEINELLDEAAKETFVNETTYNSSI